LAQQVLQEPPQQAVEAEVILCLAQLPLLVVVAEQLTMLMVFQVVQVAVAVQRLLPLVEQELQAQFKVIMVAQD
jgi:hypothetical protein